MSKNILSKQHAKRDALTFDNVDFFYYYYSFTLNIPETIFLLVYELAQESVNVPASLSVFNADTFYTYM